MQEPQYDNRNRGFLFRNENKLTSESPDYTGKIDVDGTPYKIRGWVSTSKKDSKKFLSITITEIKAPEQKAQAKTEATMSDF